MSVATAIELTPAQPPGAVQSGAPPGAPPGAMSFDRALEGELARTAPAEGQHREGAEGAAEASHPSGRHEGAQEEQQGAVAQVPAAVPVAPVLESSLTVGSAATDAAGQEPPTGASAASPAPGAEGQLPPAPAPAAMPDEADGQDLPAPAPPLPGEQALSGATTDPPLSVAGTERKPPPPVSPPAEEAAKGIAVVGGQQKVTLPELTVASTNAPPTAEAASPEGTRTPQSPAGQEVAGGQQTSKDAGGAAQLGVSVTGSETKGTLSAQLGGASPDLDQNPGAQAQAISALGEPATSQAPPPAAHHTIVTAVSSEVSATAAPSAEGADTVTTTPALAQTPAPVSAAPSSTGAAQAPVLATGVGMQEMIDSVRATIGLAVRQGISQARIALQPAELGEIRVHLSQGSEGLIARVTAGSEAAAQALASGRSELHHSLSTIGTSLLRLEIGSFNQPGQGRERGAGDTAGSAPARAATAAAASIESDETAAEAASAPSGGARGEMVDVLV